MHATKLAPWRRLGRFDEGLSALALALMVLIPIVEIALRPLMGGGIENAPVLVQHFGKDAPLAAGSTLR